MFGPKMGTWWIRSELDPRWNKEGKGYGLVTSGGPSEMGECIEQCKKLFGEPPKDLTINFMKD